MVEAEAAHGTAKCSGTECLQPADLSSTRGSPVRNMFEATVPRATPTVGVPSPSDALLLRSGGVRFGVCYLRHPVSKPWPRECGRVREEKKTKKTKSLRSLTIHYLKERSGWKTGSGLKGFGF